MPQVRGIIFDVDGTLVDSNDAHASSWVEALAEGGRSVPFEKVRALIGMGGDKVLPEVAGLSDDSAEGKQIADRRQAIFMAKYLPKLRPFPASGELLKFLKERGHRLVVASSAKEEELERLLTIAGADGHIEHSTSSSDAERSKPDPDIVEAAFQTLGLRHEEVMMVGDTPYDIEAAARAGLRAIAFRTGGWDDRALGHALAIYDGPADLLAHHGTSPLAAL
jgi:HAD superfamily hydrolase (TIGR01509 family)